MSRSVPSRHGAWGDGADYNEDDENNDDDDGDDDSNDDDIDETNDVDGLTLRNSKFVAGGRECPQHTWGLEAACMVMMKNEQTF